MGKAGRPCLRMQQENDEVCGCGLTKGKKGKKSCLPNMQSWLLEGLGRDNELPAQVSKEKVAGRRMPSLKNHVKAAVEETSNGARESQKCDNEVQKTWLCSSM